MATVKLFGALRKAAPSPLGPVEGGSVQRLLENLCRQHPTLQAELFDEGQLRPHIRVILNGQDITFLQGLETPVNPEDQIAIFPPIAGGSNDKENLWKVGLVRSLRLT